MGHKIFHRIFPYVNVGIFEIFYGIFLVSQNVVMDLNNVMLLVQYGGVLTSMWVLTYPISTLSHNSINIVLP